MKTISRDRLEEMRQARDDVTVVDVLGPDAYKEYHIPGAINVPVGDGFANRIQEAVPDKQKPVVVYCMDEACQASPKAALEMGRLGYQEVYDYEAGKKDWQEAGLPVVAGTRPG